MTKDETIAQLRAENQRLRLEFKAENDYLRQELKELKRLIFGSKNEGYKRTPLQDDVQLSLFSEDSTTQSEEEEQVEHISYTRKKKKKNHQGRTEIPSHFPVEERLIEPEEDTTDMVKVGEEVSEYVEYTPASFKKIRIIRPKYAPKEKEGSFVIAPLPSRPFPKLIASYTLISHLLVRKFIEHMPFYRQQQAIKRDYQWIIPSSTINDWFIQACVLLTPLYTRLKEKVLESTYLQVDESPMKVQDKNKKGATHQGYQWVYHNPIDQLLFFHYRKGRGMQGPKEILSNYKGILQSDGYQVYDKIGAAKKEIHLVGCIAHARRYFHKALTSDKKRAEYALSQFQKIYDIERKLKDSSPEVRKEERRAHTLPLLNELKSWMEKESIYVPPKSVIGKAMGYFQNQWDKLIAITEDGRCEIDNNLIENKIRPLALGRKNYLFAGSHEAAQRIAMMYSFFGSCKANNVNPSDWLNDTLEKLPDTKLSDLEQLLPNNF